MTDSTKANIVVIDDYPDDYSALKLLHDDIEPLHPSAVNLDVVKQADLVLLDYDLEYWPDRDALESICLQPFDGLALASVLRSQLQKSSHSAPVSFAIYTGQIDKLARPLPPENREHALAELVNVDWIFQKKDGPVSFNKIRVLAEAVKNLPKVWLEENSMQQLGEFLGLNYSESENQQYMLDIEACLPPIHELSEWSHGISVIRWLLHRILPYPTFLLSSHYLAARFRVSRESLEKHLETNQSLDLAMKEFEYKGALAEFGGRRWWRSGIEEFLWRITDGKSSDFSAVRLALENLAKEGLAISEPPDFPVICLDENYRELPRFYSEEEVVRIRPDHYPSYADQPWIPKELAQKNPKMRALVLRDDLNLLD